MLLQTICLLHTLIPFVLSGREYILVEPTTVLEQAEAEDFCANTYQVYDGHLATIDSESANDEVAALCPDSPGRNDGCYIGLYASNLDEWTDGTAVTYTNWKDTSKTPNRRSQPVVGGQREAVLIKPSTEAIDGGKWRTAQDNGFPFICQKDTTITVFNWETFIYGDRLLTDERLYSGEALVSTNRRYVAALQTDGNFVVYDLGNGAANAVATYNTGTAGNGNEQFLVLQGSDGNIVLYETNGGARWNSGTHYGHVYMLIMQDDGNLVAYTTPATGSQAFWNTGTSNGGVLMQLVAAVYNPSTQQMFQQSVPLIATFIGAVTCVLLICVYGIKHSAPNKELQPLLKVSGSHATF